MNPTKMCANYKCESRKYCNRYTQEPNEDGQMFMVEAAIKIDKCNKYGFSYKEVSDTKLEAIDARNELAIRCWQSNGYIEDDIEYEM